MGIPQGHVLKGVKLLYFIPESGLYWYLIYLHYHLDVLGIKRPRANPCVQMRQTNNHVDGRVILKVYDSFEFGTEDFLDKDTLLQKSFEANHIYAMARAPSR